MNRTEYVLNALRIAEEQQVVRGLYELFGANSAEECNAKYRDASLEQRAIYDRGVERVIGEAEKAFLDGARQMGINAAQAEQRKG